MAVFDLRIRRYQSQKILSLDWFWHVTNQWATRIFWSLFLLVRKSDTAYFTQGLEISWHLCLGGPVSAHCIAPGHHCGGGSPDLPGSRIRLLKPGSLHPGPDREETRRHHSHAQVQRGTEAGQPSSERRGLGLGASEQSDNGDSQGNQRWDDLKTCFRNELQGQWGQGVIFPVRLCPQDLCMFFFILMGQGTKRYSHNV